MTPEQCAEKHGRAATRRAARHALWRAGDLRYALHRGQAAALDAFFASAARRFVLCTGRRWGKSRLMCVVAVLVCVLRWRFAQGQPTPPYVPEWLRVVVERADKPARVVYAAPTAGMVDEFIEPHMRLLAEHAPPEYRPEPQQGAWVFPDGAKIVIRGCEDTRKADRLRGPEADLGIVDEGGFIPILAYVVKSVVGPQLWETRGRMLLPSTPPESTDHEFVALLAEAEASGAAFRARTADAPHMTEEMLEEAIADAGGPTSLDWLREGEALVLRNPREVVFPEWPETRAGEANPLVGERERPEHFFPYVVGDHGYVDLCVLAFGYYDFAADIDVIEAEIVLSHATSDRIDAEVRAMERRLWGERPVKLRAIDATPQVRADMSAARFQSIEAEEPAAREEVLWAAIEGEPIAAGPEVLYWQPVRKDDKHAAVNGARLRLGQRRVLIHPRCATIRAHAEYARWNKQRTDFERPASAEHHYDGAAALVYFLRMLDRQANPVPRLPQRPADVSEDDWMIDPTVERREAAKRGAFTGRRSRRRR